tara:strand:+ start:757 stop:1503 length:747 start_codon:yes stop_codon:yes gene_type:complete
MQSEHNYVVVIPARYHSTRLPGKPLIKILGIEMLQRTYNRCLKVVDKEKIFVATDSEKIIDFCNKNDIQSILTSKNCLTGTDRIAEVSKIIDAKVYINVQGDEPLLNPDDLKLLIESSEKNPDIIFNGYCEIDNQSQYISQNIPKVVFSNNKELLYMSRSPIPHHKNKKNHNSYRQVCIYAYPKEVLSIFLKQPKKTVFESYEDIEILRFLELGCKIKMLKMSSKSVAVDVPEDVIKVEEIIRLSNEK